MIMTRNHKQCSRTHVGSTQVPFLMCTLEIPPKIAAQVLALTFSYLVYFRASLSTMRLSSIFVLASSFKCMVLSIIQTQHPRASLICLNSLYQSFCTFICQVPLLTSSCQFFTNTQCSLLPCASLMFFRFLFIMLHQGSLGFLTVPHWDFC